MKVNKKDLSNLIYKIITESNISENVFEIDSDDTNMQQKISKLKNDTSLYNDNEDEIKITNNSEVTESEYKKSDVLKLMKEAKNKKAKNNVDDMYLKAIKKADRESEYDIKGAGWKAKDRPHKNKSKYNRKDKDFSNNDMNECVLNKSDINNLILEKKYNAKVYTKSNLFDEINNNDTVF